MVVKMKSPTCCAKHMDLKSSYWSGATYFVFQCLTCGTIIEKTSGELEETYITNVKDILKKRYANGEITREEYNEKMSFI